MFDPLVERAHHVERVWPFAAAAVVHTGDHEQPHPRTGLRQPTGGVHHARVIVDARTRRNRTVGPPVIHQKLPAIAGKFLEVGIGHIGYSVVHLVCLREIAVEIERSPVPVWIFENNILEVIDGPGDRVFAAERPRIR